MTRTRRIDSRSFTPSPGRWCMNIECQHRSPLHSRSVRSSPAMISSGRLCHNGFEKDKSMSLDPLRGQISEFLGFRISEAPVPYETGEVVEEDGYRRLRISYPSPEGD